MELTLLNKHMLNIFLILSIINSFIEVSPGGYLVPLPITDLKAGHKHVILLKFISKFACLFPIPLPILMPR